MWFDLNTVAKSAGLPKCIFGYRVKGLSEEVDLSHRCALFVCCVLIFLQIECDGFPKHLESIVRT